MLTDKVCTDKECKSDEYRKFELFTSVSSTTTENGEILCKPCDMIACPGGCYKLGKCKLV